MALLHRRSTSKRASQKMWENNAAMPDDASANDNVSSARPEPAAFVPTPFDEVIDISDLVAERRRLQRNLWAMRIITIVLLIAAIAVACFPLALQFESDRNLAATTATTAKEVAGWPYPQAEDKLTAARAYNKKLAESGQPILGEAVDPFAAAQGGSQASGEDSASKKDKEYQSLLNTGNGVMGTIKVPKQSINLPFYHGTSEEALASGAGHLYGTSLPVGGKSTHSVITGHRGLVEALMFTRLDEVKEGDFFYIEVMGETLGYKVDRISVILPDDTSKLKIVPGEDRVTLMTCTPYGVNTHRLLISGHRVAIPMPAPEPNDVLDARNIALGVGLGILAAGLFIIWLARCHKAARIIRHGAFWPWMRRKGESANDTLA
ncbi:class C sortase [Bifidobacterium longum]|uniref:class C sortase n=1 Tax=Bifidobacterium longum TaxID=216816 RepID=UPI002E77EC4B|nr:class C sortase [Bifidobacterium longum]